MRSLHFRLSVTAFGLIIALLSVSLTPEIVHASSAASSVVAYITGTGIGLMFRTDPNDWNSRGGPAGYDGDAATLHCEVMGTPVGPYNNKAWYDATTRFGSGWIPDHFLDTPIVANQWLPGLPRCGQNAPALTSMFFSPNDKPGGLSGLVVSDKDTPINTWAAGNCSDKAFAETGIVPNTATTLAGWSKGRLGPVYFLSTATAAQKLQVRTIILFDPGNLSDFEGRVILGVHLGNTCDWKYNINSLLANWLRLNQGNRLIVFTGHDSEGNGFAGLWKYYFAGIWNQPFAGQALVCDYSGMGHPAVLSNFAWTIKETPSACPSAGNGQQPVSWHP